MSKDLFEFGKTMTAMFTPTTKLVNFSWKYYLTNRTMFFLAIVSLGHVLGIKRIGAKFKSMMLSNSVTTILYRIILLLLFAMDILYVVNSTYSPFIYFQF